MTDLHSRITAALLREDQLRVCKLSDADIKFMADAVIAELGLRRESMTDGISPVDDPPAWHHRYVTSWVADDKPQQNREFTE